jgi:hypothetical protein
MFTIYTRRDRVRHSDGKDATWEPKWWKEICIAFEFELMSPAKGESRSRFQFAPFPDQAA